ncbi:hypothetical protein ACMDCT_01585 [Halomonadaceae bacterium KBTZ08]
MQWSKLKKRHTDLLAESLRGRLDIHVTEIRKVPVDLGLAWITFKGEKIVSVTIPTFYDRNFDFSTDTADFGRAIGFIVENDIEQLKNSNDPVVRGLIFLDRRVGKRYLQQVESSSLHPFTRVLFQLRCRADGLEC